MRNNPQIQQLRELIRQNPDLAQPVLQQLVQSNPHISQAINQNPEIFNQLLGIDDDGTDAPSGATVISVTEEEQAAIQRVSVCQIAFVFILLMLSQLEALGFSRQAVLEAYLACDRNEELAANYLFEQYED